MSELKPCNCGYGSNWYCLGGGSASHEFNTGKNPTAKKYEDRQPIAVFYGHIDEKYAVALVLGGAERKKFKYTNGGRKQALHDAANWIEQELENEQLGLFGGAA